MAKESGQYVIDRELGRGSYGSVYLLICPASPSQPPVSKVLLMLMVVVVGMAMLKTAIPCVACGS